MMLIESPSSTDSPKAVHSSPSPVIDVDNVDAVDDGDGVETPSDTDVLLGRGAGCWNHPGNRTFRDIVHKHLCSYDNAKLRVEKTHIVSVILDLVHANNGRFLKKDHITKKWHVVDRQVANEKIGHAIRDRRATAKTAYESANDDQYEEQDEQHSNVRKGMDIEMDLQKRQQDHQDAYFSTHPSNQFITPLLRGEAGLANLAAFSNALGPTSATLNPTFRRELPLPGLHGRNRFPPPTHMRRPFFNPSPVPNPNQVLEQQLQDHHRTLIEQSSSYLQNASEALRKLQTTQQAMKAIAAQRQQQQQQQRQHLQRLTSSTQLQSAVMAMHRAAATAAVMNNPQSLLTNPFLRDQQRPPAAAALMLNKPRSLTNPFLTQQQPPLRLQRQVNHVGAGLNSNNNNNNAAGAGATTLMELARLSTMLERLDQIKSSTDIVIE